MDVEHFKDKMSEMVCQILDNLSDRMLVQYYASHLLTLIDGFEIDVDVNVDNCMCDCKVKDAIKETKSYDSNLLTP